MIRDEVRGATVDDVHRQREQAARASHRERNRVIGVVLDERDEPVDVRVVVSIDRHKEVARPPAALAGFVRFE